MKRIIVFISCILFGSPVWAAEEIIIRNAMNFPDCPATISMMLERIGANKNHVQTISDTGAHYYIELKSTHANLQFRCNAVTQQMEVARITPGTLNLAAD